MSRKYVKINEYEKQILELKQEGKTNREIAQVLGVDKECIKNWVVRFNRQQRKMEAGIKPRPKGRPRKDAQPRDKLIAAQCDFFNNSTDEQERALFDALHLSERDAIRCFLHTYFSDLNDDAQYSFFEENPQRSGRVAPRHQCNGACTESLSQHPPADRKHLIF